MKICEDKSANCRLETIYLRLQYVSRRVEGTTVVLLFPNIVRHLLHVWSWCLISGELLICHWTPGPGHSLFPRQYCSSVTSGTSGGPRLTLLTLTRAFTLKNLIFRKSKWFADKHPNFSAFMNFTLMFKVSNTSGDTYFYLLPCLLLDTPDWVTVAGSTFILCLHMIIWL